MTRKLRIEPKSPGLLGEDILRKAWLNLDGFWAVALMITGLATIMM